MKKTLLFILSFVLILFSFIACEEEVFEPKKFTMTYMPENGEENIVFETNTFQIPEEEPIKEDFIFSGWYDEADKKLDEELKDTNITKNYTYIAKWISDSVTITLLDEDSNITYSSITAKYGSSIKDIIPEAPEKDGYSFDGWYLNGNKLTETTEGTVGFDGLTLVAKWKVKDITITLLDEDGTTTYTAINVEFGSLISEIDAGVPEKSGYSFDAWYLADGETKLAAASGNVGVDGLTLIAKWTAKSITITLVDEDGSSRGTTTVAFGSNISEIKPSSQTKEGHSFIGWFIGDNQLTKDTTGTVGINGLTLEARWNPIDISITLVDEDSNITYDSIKALYGSSISAIKPPVKTKTGYELDGWYLNGVKLTNTTEGKVGINGLTLEARWNPIDITITLVDQDGTSRGTTTVKFDSLIKDISPATQTKNGYEFDGWYLNDVKLTDETTGTVGINGLTLEARWNPIDISITLVDEDSNITYDSIKALYGSSISAIKPPAKTKTGYEFDGWYLNGVKLTNDTAGTVGTSGLTLEARWNPIDITITLVDEDGTSRGTTTVEYGSPIKNISPSEQAKTGYEFDGWYLNDVKLTNETTGTVGINGLTLEARWNPIDITITLVDEDGTSRGTTTVEYGSPIKNISPSEQAKTGYEFDGWYINGVKLTNETTGTVGINGLTLEARWNPINITITLVDEDETSRGTITVEFDSLIKDISPATQTKTGYEFDGWYLNGVKLTKDSEGSVGINGLTLIAKWNPIDVTITLLDQDGSSHGGDTVKFGSAISSIIPNALADKTGYSFDGWYLNGVKLTSSTQGTVGINGLTLTAKWTAKDIEITLLDEDGSSLGTTTAKYDSKISEIAPNTPTKTGYGFDGWYLENGITPVENATGIVDENGLTLIAKWDANGITITLIDEDESIPPYGTVSVKFGSAISSINPTDPEKTGYDFAGWYLDGEKLDKDIEGTVGIDGLTLVATWTLKDIEIKLIDEDESITYKSTSAKYSSAISAISPDEPEKEGHSFSGWYLNGVILTKDTIGTVGIDGLTLEARWTTNEIDIILTDEDSNITYDSIKALYGSSISAIKPPTKAKTGYELDGWYLNGVKLTNTTEGKVGINGLTLEARWNPIDIDITLEDEDITVTYDSIKVEFDSAISAIKPPAKTKTGYEFDGWYLNGAKLTSSTQGTVGIDGLTLVAKWNPIDIDITLIDEDELIEYDSIKVKFDSAISEIAPPAKTKEGHTFSGWYLNGVELTDKTEGTVGIDGLTLTAKWTVDDVTITLVDEDSSSRGTTTVKYGSLIKDISPSTQAKTGYEFDGWYLNDVKLTNETTGTVGINGLTLEARWNPIDITITLVDEDSTSRGTTTVKYGSLIKDISPATQTKTGYEFDGWYLNDVKLTNTTEGKVGINGLTLEARWNPIDITITLVDEDGASRGTTTVKYGSLIKDISPSTQTKTGYTFDGWYLNGVKLTKDTEGTVGVDGLTLIAKWNPIDVTITLVDQDGSSHGSDTVKFGSAISSIIPNALADKTGYSFDGWYLNGVKLTSSTQGTVGINGLTLEARWSLVDVTITLLDEVSTVTYDAITAKYGSNISSINPGTPEKLGFNFEGWYIGEDKLTSTTAGTLDLTGLTLTARWSVAKFTVSFDTQGGPEIESKVIEYNKVVTKPTDPAKDGYEFVSWIVKGDETKTAFVFTTKITKDTELVAVWNPLFTITLDPGEGTFSKETETIITKGKGSTITLPTPTLNGDALAGWYDGDTRVPRVYTLEKDVTLIAKYALPKVIFKPWGEGDDIIQDDILILPEAPVEEGYEFMGWFDEEGVILDATLVGLPIVQNKVYEPIFELNLLKLFVDINYKGNDSDGASVKPFKTIAEAIEKVAEKGTITIAPGEYKEDLVIDKRLSIVTTGADIIWRDPRPMLEQEITTAHDLVISDDLSESVVINGSIEIKTNLAVTITNIVLKNDNEGSKLIHSSIPNYRITLNSSVLYPHEKGHAIYMVTDEVSTSTGYLTLDDCYIGLTGSIGEGVVNGIFVASSPSDDNYETAPTIRNKANIQIKQTEIEDLTTGNEPVYPISVVGFEYAYVYLYRDHITVKEGTNTPNVWIRHIGDAARQSNIKVISIMCSGWNSFYSQNVNNTLIELSASKFVGVNTNTGRENDFYTVAFEAMKNNVIKFDGTSVYFDHQDPVEVPDRSTQGWFALICPEGDEGYTNNKITFNASHPVFNDEPVFEFDYLYGEDGYIAHDEDGNYILDKVTRDDVRVLYRLDNLVGVSEENANTVTFGETTYNNIVLPVGTTVITPMYTILDPKLTENGLYNAGVYRLRRNYDHIDQPPYAGD